MFDATKNGRGPGGFLTANKNRALPRLENLESREVPAVIGGIVYNDVNLDGLWQTTEPGIPHTTVTLVDSSNHAIAATTTNGAGNYQFTERNINTNVPAESSYTYSFGPTNSSVPQLGTVSQFDPTLGTLTSVELIATGSTSSHAVVENLDPSSQAVQLQYSNDIKYNVNGITVEGTGSTTQQSTLGAFDGQADLKGVSSKDFGNISVSAAITKQTLTSPSDLAAFIGTGTVHVAESATAQVCPCNSADTGNLLSMVNTTASGSLKVVYHYTPSNVIGPGQYKVVETQPPGYKDSFDTGDNLTPIPGSNHTDTIAVTINSVTDQSTSNNFGEVVQPISPPPPDTAPPPVTPPDSPSKFMFLFNL